MQRTQRGSCCRGHRKPAERADKDSRREGIETKGNCSCQLLMQQSGHWIW